MKRTAQGMILGTDGEKMSKSRGNVINPDDVIDEIGADSFRLYEMFMGAFDQAIPWQTDGARGCRRFLDRVWKLMEIMTTDEGTSSCICMDAERRGWNCFSLIRASSDNFRHTLPS